MVGRFDGGGDLMVARDAPGWGLGIAVPAVMYGGCGYKMSGYKSSSYKSG